MPYIRRGEGREILGIYSAQQHEGQEFLDKESKEFKTHLLKELADEKKRDLESVAIHKMVSRLFTDSPEKVTCTTGQEAINAAKDEEEQKLAFQTALKALE